jgi:hypothetical protein
VEEERRALALSCWAGSAVGWASSWAAREKGGKGEKESRPGGGGRRLGRAQEQRGRESFSFYFLFPFSFKTKHISKQNLNSFKTLVKPLITINPMQRHACSNKLLTPIVNFNSTKNIIFPIFHGLKKKHNLTFYPVLENCKFWGVTILPP